MDLITALALSIGVLGGIATFVLLSFGMGLQIWVAFIAWATFYHCGGKEAGLTKALTNNIFGAIMALIGLLLVFFLLTQYNTWTLIGVLEEKSSRVVEVLLATVPAVRLLAGKVLGIGLTVFVQAGLAMVVALSIAHATHSDVLHGTTTLSIAATLVWLVLGYAFYSWVYAAAGAMVSRQDQVQSLAFPLALPVIFGYIVSLSAATSGNPSLLVHVLAYLPPTAPLAMPTLVGLGAVSWWQFAASAVISLAGTVVVARVAAGVYQRAILQTGRRVRLREALARS